MRHRCHEQLEPRLALSGVSFISEEIGSVGNPRSILLFDPDGDDDLDILVAFGYAAWFENDGSTPRFPTRHEVFDGEPIGSYVGAGDLDSDGDEDIVAASHSNGIGRVVWHANHRFNFCGRR